MQDDKRFSLDDYASMGNVGGFKKTDMSRFRNLDPFSSDYNKTLYNSDKAQTSAHSGGQTEKTAASSTGSASAGHSTSAAKKSASAAASSSKGRTQAGAASERKAAGESRKPKGKDTRGERPSSKKERAAAEKKKKKNNKPKASRQQSKESSKRDRGNRETVVKKKNGASHDETVKERSERVKKRRWLKGVLAVILLVAVVAGGGMAYAYNEIKIEKILVEGESVYSSEKIIKKSTLAVGQRILAVDGEEISQKLTKELPYLSTVEIRKDFSDGNALVLTVADTKDALVIKNGKGWFCVDENNKVLSLKKKKLTDGMFRIEGLKEQKVEAGDYYVPSEENLEAYEAAKKAARALRLSGQFAGCVINAKDKDDIIAVYDSRISLYFGASIKELGENVLAEKLGYAFTAAQQVIGDTEKGYVLLEIDGRVISNKGSLED